ncbi:MAG: type II secretion system protein N [Acidiferrobacterales bacterium]
MNATVPGQLTPAGRDMLASLWKGLQTLLAQRWLPGAVNFAALVVLAWGMAGWTWMLLAPNVPEVIPDGNAASAGQARFDLHPLLTSQIFGQAPSLPGTGGVSLDAIPISSLNLVLAGVVAAGGASFALISVNGQPQEPFAIGQEVTAGAILQAVYPDRVLLIRQGITESLMLEGVNDNAGGGVSSGAPISGATGGIYQRSQNDYVVPRSVVNAQLHKPQDLLSQALMVPNPTGGFLVREIQPDSVYQKLGLQVGDVIRSVNGQPVNSLQDAMRAYQQAANLSDVRLEVVRGGRPEVLQYQIK